MKASSVVAYVATCTFILGCDTQPSVLFVAHGGAFHMLQLTDAEEECITPYRLCYLTSWDGTTSRGCWLREETNIRARFPDSGDKLVPVVDFRRTTLAEYRNATLE